MSKVIAFIASMMLLSACQPRSFEQAVTENFNRYLDTATVSCKYIMLIPNSGCTGCISDAEYFFKEYSDNNDILYIFTHVMSQKDLRIRVGKENIQRKNVIVDKENRFFFDQFQEAIYPIVAVIKNNKVTALKEHTFLREIYPPKE